MARGGRRNHRRWLGRLLLPQVRVVGAPPVTACHSQTHPMRAARQHASHRNAPGAPWVLAARAGKRRRMAKCSRNAKALPKQGRYGWTPQPHRHRRVAHLKVPPAVLDARVNHEEQRCRTLAVGQRRAGQRAPRTQVVAKPLDEGPPISDEPLNEPLLESVFDRQPVPVSPASVTAPRWSGCRKRPATPS